VWGIPLGMRIKVAVGDRDIASIAEEIGVSRTTIYNWMAGSNEPDLETLAKLAGRYRRQLFLADDRESFAIRRRSRFSRPCAPESPRFRLCAAHQVQRKRMEFCRRSDRVRTRMAWMAHCNRGRPHSSLGPGVPDPHCALQPPQRRRHHFDRRVSIVSRPVLGGLHHQYGVIVRAA